MTTIPGRVTTDGTERYRARFTGVAAPNHFRRNDELWLSSLGIGTYLGNPDEATNARYADTISRAVELGCNVIDTAANYRFQRSERAIGVGLRRLIASGDFSRDEIVICTKGGYLPFDGAPPPDLRTYIEETFVQTGIASFDDIVGGSHCMTPRYLQSQIDQSLSNLGLESIDVYYLHNPESQLGAVSHDEFDRRLAAAFELFEQNVAEGKIRRYGVATWNGFRVESNARGFHSLERMVEIAREVAGDSHGFRFVQLPFNLAMPEALSIANQPLGPASVSLLEAARALGVAVVASASILQGQVAQGLSQEVRDPLGNLRTDAQTAIQFVRSTPGITTALVGMSRLEHVEENLELIAVDPVSTANYQRLFRES